MTWLARMKFILIFRYGIKLLHAFFLPKATILAQRGFQKVKRLLAELRGQNIIQYGCIWYFIRWTWYTTSSQCYSWWQVLVNEEKAVLKWVQNDWIHWQDRCASVYRNIVTKSSLWKRIHWRTCHEFSLSSVVEPTGCEEASTGVVM